MVTDSQRLLERLRLLFAGLLIGLFLLVGLDRLFGLLFLFGTPPGDTLLLRLRDRPGLDFLLAIFPFSLQRDRCIFDKI
jgi:hypothetical protein